MKVDVEFDLEFIRVGLDELEEYLLSNEIYWPLAMRGFSRKGSPPKFTLGVLLLTLQKYSRGLLTPAQQAQYQRYEQQAWKTRQKWGIAWGKKAAQEYRARLTLWTNFINEYREDKEEHAGRYGYEVQRRVMLDLLGAESQEIPEAFREAVRGTDALIRAVLIPGKFAWDEALEVSFPRERFWYLYGSLPVE